MSAGAWPSAGTPVGTLDLTRAQRYPIIASSRTLPDDSGVLAVGTGPGSCLSASDPSSPGDSTLR